MVFAGVDLTGRCLALIGCICVGYAQNASPERGSVPTFGTTVVASYGLRGEIYFIPFGSTSLPRFKHSKPVGTIYTTRLNVPIRDFREGFPGITNRFEWFAIDYAGRFWAQPGGEYGFSLISDDGSKLYIDHHLIIDDDGIHGPFGCSALVELERGIHDIRVSYFQGPRYEVALILSVQKPGAPWRIFDTTDFMPPPESAKSALDDDESIGKRVRKVKVGRCWAQ